MIFRKLWNKLFGKKTSLDADLKALQRLSEELRSISDATTQISGHEVTLEQSLQNIKSELTKLESLYSTETHQVTLRSNAVTPRSESTGEQGTAELHMANPPTNLLQ